MEEADALSTRIAIQVCGHLVCIGSPQHLKSRFGSGYLLELQSSSTATHTIISTKFPHATLLEHFNSLRRYRIPKEDIEAQGGLGGVFDILEEMKRMGVIDSVQFSQTTLDQIFIKFAKRQEEEDARAEEGRVGKKGK